MKPYIRPQITVFGDVSDLTKSKTASGTDSFVGSQPTPGTVCFGGTCLGSSDSILNPSPPLP